MRRLALLMTTAAALGAAGCNSTQTTRVRGRVVAIRIVDYRLVPQNVSVRRGVIAFEVRNAGRQPTNFRIRGRGRKRGGVPTLQPGASGRVTLRLRPGSYTMYSSVGRDEVLGEFGTLTIR